MNAGRAVLGGRYELVRLLGEGGMSQVHLARDRELGRDVAVKLLPGSGDADAEDLARLRDEARAAAAISHPGVVTVHDVGESADGVFVVMAYVDGESLVQRIRRSGPLEPADAVAVGQAVCDALGAAHRAGVVHRDVTPGNIMLGRDGSVTVTDFGIARIGQGAGRTRTGYIIGTPSYMAPEQGHGRELDGRADIYALGCCLFTALVGRPPFEDDDSFAVVLAHMRSDPPRPRRLRADIPERLEAVILRALAKDPDRSYPDAAAMSAALGESVGRGNAGPGRQGGGGSGTGTPPRAGTLTLPDPSGTGDPPWARAMPGTDDPTTVRQTAGDPPVDAAGPERPSTALQSTIDDVETAQGDEADRRRGIGVVLIVLAGLLVVLVVAGLLFLT